MKHGEELLGASFPEAVIVWGPVLRDVDEDQTRIYLSILRLSIRDCQVVKRPGKIPVRVFGCRRLPTPSVKVTPHGSIIQPRLYTACNGVSEV